ncbi:15156_t:CDS:2 [Cetraspora pellucida]|uniref:15156_t:CDS:1 n=1 Tax=Cetraspora pellucida TaxID=1433469 RepID=A0A9N9BXF6_9GLOM|nr:15156_t:CDS:2 [Cetraspora pellucida]
MSSTNPKETKTTLTNEQRKAIIVHKDKNPNINAIGENPLAKRQRTVQHLDLEDMLYEWILQSQDCIILSDDVIIKKAKNLAKLFHISENDFKFSHEDASVDDAIIAEALPRLREILKEYDLKDIYNMDETGLFYQY